MQSIEKFFRKIHVRDLDSQLFFKSFSVFFFSTLTSSLGMIVDGLVIGNTMNVSSVASYGLISPMNYAFALIGSLLNSGTMNMCANALGRNNKQEANSIFSMSFFTSIIISIAFAASIIIFVNPIMTMLRIPVGTELFEQSRGYLIAFVFGLPAITCTKLLASIMQLDSDPKRAVYSVVVITSVNTIGDLVCVKLFNANLVAIAIVTAISYYAGVFVLMLHFLKKNIIFRFVFRKLEWNRLPQILKRGLPKAISRVTSTVSSLYINMVLVEVATAAVAGYSVFNSLRFALNAIVFGVGQAMMFLTSLYYGEENKRALLKICKISFISQLFFTGLSFAIMTFLSEDITVIYLGKNAEAYSFANAAIFWGALGTIFAGINILLADYLQATKRIWPANLVYILENVVYLILAVNLTWNDNPSENVFVGIFLSHVFMTVTIPIFIIIQNRRMIKSPEDLLMMDKNFGVSPEDEFLMMVHDQSEVIEASIQISNFCKKKNVSGRKTYILAMVVEELGTNAVKHGFKEEEENYFSVRIIYKPNILTLILRDNCGYFDPVKRYKFLNDSDPESNIGIRMVMEMAKDVTFSSACKLNNVIIKI